MIVYHAADRFLIEYLLLKHTHGNHWSFPKGTVEADESDWQTAVRELQEETGIDTFEKQPDFAEELFYQFERDGAIIDKSVIYFLGQVPNQIVTISEEHTEFVWLPYAQARPQLTHDNGRLMLDKAHQYLTQSK